jgi:hypothetical protein
VTRSDTALDSAHVEMADEGVLPDNEALYDMRVRTLKLTIPTDVEWNHIVSAARTVQLHTFGSLGGCIVTFVR